MSFISTTDEHIASGGTISGDLTIDADLSVTGSTAITTNEVIQGTSIIDVTNAEAFLVRKDSDGGDILTVDTTNSIVKVGGDATIIKAGGTSLIVGSTNAGGASITLDGDSNGDGSGADYSYIHHDNAGILNIVQDSPSGTNEIRFGTAGTEDKITIDASGNLIVGSDGSGADVTFYSATAGDSFVWDASEEKLTITGTNGQTALDIADGNLVVADNVDIEGDIDVNGTTNLDVVNIADTLDIGDSSTHGLGALSDVDHVFTVSHHEDTSSGAFLVISGDQSGSDANVAHISFCNNSQTASSQYKRIAEISARRVDEDTSGQIDFTTWNAGTGVASFRALKTGVVQFNEGITTEKSTVFNEAGGDYDFRIESNNNAYMFFLDAGNDRVGIGASSTEATFEVAGTSGEISKFGTLTNDWAANHAFGIVNGNGIMISDADAANNTAANRVMALQRDDTNGHAIYIYDPAGNVDIALKGNASSYVKGGSFGVGTDSPATKFQVVDTSNMKYENNQLTLTRDGGHLLTLLNAGTAIANNEALGYMRWEGNENGAGQVTGGSIEVHCEKDWSGNSDCPTRMTFHTTNDGSANATEKMRITEAGDIGVGQTSPTVRLHIKDDNSLDDCQLKVENDGTGDAGIGFLLTGVTGFAMGIDNSHANNALIIGGNDDAIGTTPYLTINPSDSSVAGDLTDTSDVAFKENIQTLSEGLSIVKKINPVSFDWKDKNKGSNSGFIAQEIEKILPNDVCGKDYNTETSPEGKSINVTGIVAHLTKAVQELSARVEALETK